MMSERVSALAAGAAASSARTATSSSLSMERVTLAALSRTGRRQGAAHPGRPIGVGVPVRDRCAARVTEPRAQRAIGVQAPQGGRQRPVVARWHDEAGVLVADEA